MSRSYKLDASGRYFDGDSGLEAVLPDVALTQRQHLGISRHIAVGDTYEDGNGHTWVKTDEVPFPNGFVVVYSREVTE